MNNKDYDVFCPYCATEHKLADEKELRISFEDKAAYFNCKSCKRVMGYNLAVNPYLVANLVNNCLCCFKEIAEDIGKRACEDFEGIL